MNSESSVVATEADPQVEREHASIRRGSRDWRADSKTAARQLLGVLHLKVFDWEGCRVSRLAILTRKANARLFISL